MNLRHLLVPILCGSWCSACRPALPADTPDDAAAAAIVAMTPGTPLGELLEMLEAELDTALADGTDDEEMTLRLARAEAITDRLLDSRLPFEWLSGEEYSLDARLRQIQSMADRVQAQIRSRATREAMLADAAALRADVVRLREEIARGGGAAPPPLSDLLSREDSARRARTPPPRPPPADTAG